MESPSKYWTLRCNCRLIFLRRGVPIGAHRDPPTEQIYRVIDSLAQLSQGVPYPALIQSCGYRPRRGRRVGAARRGSEEQVPTSRSDSGTWSDCKIFRQFAASTPTNISINRGHISAKPMICQSLRFRNDWHEFCITYWALPKPKMRMCLLIEPRASNCCGLKRSYLSYRSNAILHRLVGNQLD